MKTFKKLLIFATAAAVIFAAVSFMLVKILLPQDKIKQYVINYARENFNREVSFDKASFTLIGITLSGFAMSENSSFSQGTFFKAKKLTLKAALKPLLNKKIEIETLGVDGMYVQILKNKNGNFNFSDLTAQKSENTQLEKDETKNKENDMPLKIDRFYVKDSVIFFKDESLKIETEISDFNTHVSGFSFDGPFNCGAQMTIKHKQNKINASVPLKIQTIINLNGGDPEKFSAEIISFETNYNDSVITASGVFKNIKKPDTDLKIMCKNITDSTFKNLFVFKTKFTVSSLDCLLKITADLENKTLLLKQADIVIPGGTIKTSGTLNWSMPKLKYTVKNEADIVLDKITEIIPSYKAGGRIKSDLNFSEKNISGIIEGISLSFKQIKPQIDIKNTNFKAVINSKEDIAVKNCSGIFNGGNFNFSGAYSKKSLDINLKIDKLVIEQPSYEKTPAKKTEITAQKQNSKNFEMNITADIAAGSVRIPYITGENAYLKVSLKPASKDMKNANGYVNCSISDGKITNTEKLSQNKFAKIFLMIFNALNNNIKQSQKPDDKTKSGINYESLIFNTVFSEGKMTAQQIDFKLPITTISTSGTIDFKAGLINLKTDSGLYAKMKITGTIDNPKTSFDTAGTLGEILKDAQSGKSSDIGKKLDNALRNLLGK